MQNPAGGCASAASDRPDDSCRPIISDLVSLIEQVQASMKWIEAAIAEEIPFANHDAAANVVVLDDVTPRYRKASAALSACNAGLGAALHFVMDNGTSRRRPDAPATAAGWPA
jgi:hypothetical protein